MPRKETSNRRVATAIRFSEAVHEALVEMSTEESVPINWLVNQAVTEWLERVELPLRLTKKETP